MNTTKKKQVTLHKNLKGPRSPQPVPKPTSNKKKPQSKSRSRGKKNSPSKDKPLKQLFATNPRNNKSPLLSKQNNTSKKSSSSSKSKSLTKSKMKSSKGRRQNVYVREEGSPRFLENLNENSFKNGDKFKMELLGYIFRKRIVRDQHYN